MRTIVRFHESAQSDYEDWIASLCRPPTGSPEMARLLESELIRELERTGGKPAGAVEVLSGHRHRWIWRFNGDTWIRYLVKEERTGLLRTLVRKVIITEIARTPFA